jgi:[acyl-carrier-protein] S-malonyltransferase
MKPAAEKLADTLETVSFADASVPVIANVTAEPATEGAVIRQLLVEQVYSPVLWEDTVQKLIVLGVDTFVEIGSGNVLAGLIKKIDRNVNIISINSVQSLEAAVNPVA